jgi:4'-phosphopantetheinyl transferase
MIQELNLNEVHIWKVVIDDPIVLKDCKAVLTEAELKRADFFKFEDGKNQYIVSQGIQRILLASYLNLPTSEVKIGRHSKGKPYSLNDSSLHFNTSNSDGLCVFGFSRDGEVGIDLEKLREVDELEDLIARNFTIAEIDFIKKKPEEELTRFFRFWTIKEGYLKAIGEGMRLTPDNLEFRIDRNKVTLISKRGIFEYDDWTLTEFTPCEGFTGTIVYENEKSTITQQWYKELTYN